MKLKPRKAKMISDINLTGNGRLRPAARRTPADPSMALPRYELRAHYFGPSDTEMEVWQLPSPATPTITAPDPRRWLARSQSWNWLSIASFAGLNWRACRSSNPPCASPAPGHCRKKWRSRSACCFGRWRPCAAATISATSSKAPSKWARKKPPIGSAWRCTARIRAACSRRFECC